MASTTRLLKSLKGLHRIPLVILLMGFGISSAHGMSSAHAVVPISDCTVISAPGSYLLTNNITAKATDLKSVGGSIPTCILIKANFVTLDLGGFTISGPGTSPLGAFGVYVPGGIGTRGTRVRNGSVTNFDRGIAFEGDAGSAEDVNLIGNDVGVTFDGLGSARNVRAHANDEFGILCFGGGGVSVRDSEAWNNGNSGINLVSCTGNSVIGNAVRQNGGAGITVSCPSLVLENVASQNAGGDIIASPSASCTQANNNPAP